MTVPRLRERGLNELSKIRVQYFLGPSTGKPALEILLVKYLGTYPYGSAGNADAQFMYAMAKAGVAVFEPWGVVHDLSELSYEWGEMLDIVFGVCPENELPPALQGIFGSSLENRRAPVAVVVSPGCEEAIRTLLLGLQSDEPIEKIGYVFRDLESAWAYVDAQIGQSMTDAGQPGPG